VRLSCCGCFVGAWVGAKNTPANLDGDSKRHASARTIAKQQLRPKAHDTYERINKSAGGGEGGGRVALPNLARSRNHCKLSFNATIFSLGATDRVCCSQRVEHPLEFHVLLHQTAHHRHHFSGVTTRTENHKRTNSNIAAPTAALEIFRNSGDPEQPNHATECHARRSKMEMRLRGKPQSGKQTEKAGGGLEQEHARARGRESGLAAICIFMMTPQRCMKSW
jgi:hypothetical protein